MGSERERGTALGGGDPRALRRDCQHRWGGEEGGGQGKSGGSGGEGERAEWGLRVSPTSVG